jgi:hypothetical protein
MVPLILFLIVVAVLFGLGLAIHVLLWVAVIFLVLWLVGFMARPHGHRWYRW